MPSPTDPYVYPGTDVLINKGDFRTPESAEQFERMAVLQRMREPSPQVSMTYEGYKELHRHLFQDVYDWAGEERTINTSKGNEHYCRTPYITREMEQRFEAMRADLASGPMTPDEFSEKAAEHICEINAIHPFREGNGRSQRLLLETFAREADYEFDGEQIDPDAWTAARRHSFSSGDYEPMRALIAGGISPAPHAEVLPDPKTTDDRNNQQNNQSQNATKNANVDGQNEKAEIKETPMSAPRVDTSDSIFGIFDEVEQALVDIGEGLAAEVKDLAGSFSASNPQSGESPQEVQNAAYFAHSVEDPNSFPPVNDEMKEQVDERREWEALDRKHGESHGVSSELTAEEKQAQMEDRMQFYMDNQKTHSM